MQGEGVGRVVINIFNSLQFLTLEIQQRVICRRCLCGVTVMFSVYIAWMLAFVFLQETINSGLKQNQVFSEDVNTLHFSKQWLWNCEWRTSLESTIGTHLYIRKEVSPTVTHLFSLQQRNHQLSNDWQSTCQTGTLRLSTIAWWQPPLFIAFVWQIEATRCRTICMVSWVS